MLKSISNSYTGLRAFQQMLSAAADNVANANSLAYRERQVSFQDLPYRELAERRLPVAGESRLPGGRGVMLGNTTFSLQQGPLIFTGKGLDLAVTGEGYLRVVRPDGSYAYTRRGNFNLDAAGHLVLPGGFRLDTALNLQDMGAEVGLSSLTITLQGSIYASPAVPETGGLPAQAVEVGRVPIYRFTNPQGLSHIGQNLFLPSASSGPPQEGVAGKDGFGQIRQGFLEGSNVDMARQVAMLIRGQRALQASARTITAADELWGLTLNLQTS